MKDTAKKIYVKPKLRNHGAIETLTQGGKNGLFTDALFPTNTPFDQLTFS